MEIESIHKYIALNKLANGSTEVLFSGQPCLTVSEGLSGNVWKINPVFAKLVYGANIFEDIPVCAETFSSSEEAIAGGLVKLHELGAFNTEYDFPEDTYAATMNNIAEDVKKKSLTESKNLMEAHTNYRKTMTALFGDTQPLVVEAEKNYDDEYAAWEASVKEKHPEKKLSFKSRIESGGKSHTTSAEVSGQDRSYGVWDHNDNTGKVFEAEEEKEPEKKEEKEIVAALKKDKKFIAKIKGE